MAPLNSTFASYLDEKLSVGALDTFLEQLKMLKMLKMLKETYSGPEERGNLLVLIYEQDAAADISIAYQKICNLLSVDPANFEPIFGIQSRERIESTANVSKWIGSGTFDQIRANSAYFPAICKTQTSGITQNGEVFSKGDIMVERDASHLTVIRNPDLHTERRFLNYYETVSTELTAYEFSALTERHFSKALVGFREQLNDELSEWHPDLMQMPRIESVIPYPAPFLWATFQQGFWNWRAHV
ncbi:hypothetical protein [uncultured Roseobacter sp.]|uniref:hypothetical protein n=1 Tax=uncultured Roseobacter sp. TaxID=114847 RepID=UPI0026284759|nr:hypothetical protein [uncultured Roseobacter sp.]